MKELKVKDESYNNRYIEIAVGLEARKIGSFYEWCMDDFEEVCEVSKLGKTRGVRQIAIALKWELPTRLYGVSPFYNQLDLDQWTKLVRKATNNTGHLQTAPKTLRNWLTNAGFKEKVQKELGFETSINPWTKLSPEEIVPELKRLNITAIHRDRSLEFFLSDKKNASAAAQAYEYLIPLSKGSAQNAMRRSLERIKGVLTGDVGDTPRKDLEEFLKVLGKNSPAGLTRNKCFSRYGARAQRYTRHEYFTFMAKAFLGAFEIYFGSGELNHYYHWTNADLKNVMDLYKITQEDMARMPGFYRFLANKFLEDYPPGSDSCRSENLHLLKEEQERARNNKIRPNIKVTAEDRD
jgi:hypothetical protein